jgi:hypothetical protein
VLHRTAPVRVSIERRRAGKRRARRSEYGPRLESRRTCRDDAESRGCEWFAAGMLRDTVPCDSLPAAHCEHLHMHYGAYSSAAC